MKRAKKKEMKNKKKNIASLYRAAAIVYLKTNDDNLHLFVSNHFYSHHFRAMVAGRATFPCRKIAQTQNIKFVRVSSKIIILKINLPHRRMVVIF